MKTLLITWLLMLDLSIAQGQAGSEPLSVGALEKRRVEIDDNTKNQMPNTLSEEVYTRLKISTEQCGSKKMSAAINQCTYYKCVKKIDIAGNPTEYSEIIIHGFNKARNCAVSGLGKRYFIPKKHLQTFRKIYEENVNLESTSISGSFTKPGSSSIQTIRIDGINCKIKAEYQTTPGQVGLNPKIVKYVLEPESLARCKKLNSTLLFDLERKGLVQDLPKTIGI